MYKRIWKVYINESGFTAVIMIEGTEEELVSYIESELRYSGYCGATDKEVEAYRTLKLPIYLASTL